MLDKNNLKRIKGIFSARLGTEIPKFQNPGGPLNISTIPGMQKIIDNVNLTIALQNTLNELNNDPEIWWYRNVEGKEISDPITITDNRIPSESSIKSSVDKKVEEKVEEKVEDEIEEKVEKSRIAGRETKLGGKDEQNLGSSNIAQGIFTGIQSIGNIFGAQQSATDSQLTKNIDTVYNGVSSTVSNMGPVGQVAGMVMNTLGAIGNISQAMGGGTDLQTKLDSWMDSPLLSWNVGAINGFFGKNTDSFGIDLETLLQVGGSYGGTTTSINEAAESADKEYGLFSSKSRKKANDAINKAKQLQNSMKNIANLASDQQLAVQSMGEQAGLAYSMMTSGGYDLKYTYAAKQGGVIEWKPNLSLGWKPKIKFNLELPEFKEGGLLEKIDWTPKLQKGNKIRTLEELIEYAKKENPRFIQRLSEKPKGIKFINDEGKESEGNVYLEWSTDNKGNAIIYPRIQEFEDGTLKFLSSNEAYNRAIDNNNVLIISPEEAKIFFAPDEEYLTAYKRGWPAMFKSSIWKHKQGGSVKESDIPEIEETNLKNVIPEGALHKNKHHMEHAEGLTKKGIPVIDGDGEQQAEIEHSEIIFTLEVTKKLEEYYQIFYSEESTNKEKEQAALDAGKLLVYQILENTEDRTGLIESCKQGGTLKMFEKELKKESFNKKLMKNVIKEAFLELLIK